MPASCSFRIIALAAALATASADAVMVVSTNFSTAVAPFTGTITGADLINAGRASLASAVFPAATFGGNGLNDGVGSATSVVQNAYYTTAQLPATATFNLNLLASPRGYDLTGIQSFAGWYLVNGAQANQKYDVYVSPIDTTNFVLLGAVDYSPFAASALANYATLVTLSEDTTGVLARNVDGIRFVLQTPTISGGPNAGVVYQEIDVLGAASTSGVAGVTQAVAIAGGVLQGAAVAGTYSVGWRFQAAQDLTVTALGVYDADGGGLSGSHTVRIYDVTHTSIVFTVPVPTNTPGEMAGGYNAHFVSVPPFALSNGTTYLIAQDKGLDSFLYDVTLGTAPGIAFDTGVGALGNLPATAAGFDIVRPLSYFGPNFKFAGSTSLVTVSVSAPPPRAIYQRDSNNVAQVRIAGSFSGPVGLIEARALVRAGHPGSNTAWTVVDAAPAGGVFSNLLPVSGGWYDIEVRAYSNGTPAVTARVSRVGAGEVFITAGQSNAANHGAPVQHPADERVSALNLNTLQWQPADDPQPYATGTGGSAWPVFGDLLALRGGVPVGVVAVAMGGSYVSQWSPPGGYVTRLTAAITALRPYGFRAILWHQGESDSIGGTAPATYAGLLTNIINRTRADAGFEVPWGVALASFHPDAAATASNQAQVVAGQWLVISNQPAAFKGAETDDFHNRGWLSDTVHFNEAGLHDHGRQWAQAVDAALLSADRDGDGLADLWSLVHFGHAAGSADDLSRADDDADGDGASNRDEQRAGTDPRDAASRLRIAAHDLTNGLARVAWASVPGRTYQVESTSNLLSPSWSNVGSTLAAYSNAAQVADSNFADRPSTSAYRVRSTP